jgi:K(+)-stimulated pyrophosphate-energized sodium pump
MIDITQNLLYLIPIAVVIALAFSLFFARSVFKRDTGTPEMEKIADAIKTGAMAYLARQYKTIGIISVILAVVIAVVGWAVDGVGLGPKVAAAFMIGAAFSILSGFIGMYVSVLTNIRTASAARNSLNDAFVTSFRGGAISGIAVAALSLLGVFMLIFAYDWIFDGTMKSTLGAVLGYAFGASFAALFAQLEKTFLRHLSVPAGEYQHRTAVLVQYPLTERPDRVQDLFPEHVPGASGAHVARQCE